MYVIFLLSVFIDGHSQTFFTPTCCSISTVVALLEPAVLLFF